MSRVPKSIQEKLVALDGLNSQGDSGNEPTRLLIREAIADHHYRVAAKAATLCADKLLYDFETDLLNAYPYFLDDAVKRDPGTVAKKAIARALVDLDCHAVDFYIAGLHYRQMEPVWGSSVDTAVDVRCSCALGLVATAYPRALQELILLLNDPEATARVGAARAITCANPREAELILYSKALAGDAEPEVIGECLTGLLQVEPDESVPFVASFLEHNDPVIVELAALALGDSRLDAALACLQSALEQPFLQPEIRLALLQAVAIQRSAAALNYLLELLQQNNTSDALLALEALALHRHNAALTGKIQALIEARNNDMFSEKYRKLWK